MMTWNLWWRFGPWAARQPAIAAVLGEEAPDIVLLQEVWADKETGEDQAQLLAAPAGYFFARSRRAARSGERVGEPYGFGNAVLSRWPIAFEETLVLPGADGEPSHRSAIIAEIDHPGGPLLVTATHLDWRYDHSELRQTQLDALLDELRRTKADRSIIRPLVIGADLNAVPSSDEVRRLTGLAVPYTGGGGRGPVFTDCWAAMTDDPGHTWTRDNPHAVDAVWPRRRLDYLLVSWPRPKPTDNPIAAHLAGHQPVGGVVASDHYAVVVDLDDRPPQEIDE